ncbi:response regulator [Erythrobacter litoralis]|uniref:response regulator transcription factor n=1 Tax=Erythrobacter litoralis TaxID=39960 RepID=UPI00243510C8|nr:response regulator [Erythrobacter litoralis]MDG6078533.1 response regulator [Erythrobacter litoralis]
MANILIANDDALAAEMATIALVEAGHRCGWLGADPELVLDGLGKQKPDLLVLDDTFPATTGAEILRRIRGSKGLSALPVVMLVHPANQTPKPTGAASDGSFRGAQAYVRKPFGSNFLLAQVNRVLASQNIDSCEDEPLAEYLAQAAQRWRDSPVVSGTTPLRRAFF